MNELDIFVRALLSNVHGSGRENILDIDIEYAIRVVAEARVKRDSERLHDRKIPHGQ